MIKIVIASQNEGKVREIREIIVLPQAELLDFRDFPDFPLLKEEGETLKDNAIYKAKTLSRWAGLPAIADDSGLEVNVLGGAPGVRSARYAGPKASFAENNQKLLRELKGVPFPRRKARFRCFAAYADLNGHLLCSVGICEGHITLEPRGTKGFGYDPLFIPQGYQKTMAELSLEGKNKISHRGQAFRKLKASLEKFLVGS